MSEDMNLYERLTAELERQGWEVRTIEGFNSHEGLYRLIVKKVPE